jgi:hypothetical protein
MLVKTDDGDLRPTPKWSIKFLIHNVMMHPLAGLCWFFGLEKLGNKIHEICVPE